MTDRGQSLKSNLQKPLLQVQKEVESLLGLLTRGGAGSGHFGHAGRPGKVGGSQPGKGASRSPETKKFYPDDIMRGQGNPGFCFSDSAEWLLYGQGKDYPQARLIHGTVMGQGPIEGIRFAHGWVEIDDWVYDPSQDIMAPKAQFYELGQAEDTISYDYTETAVELLKNKNWGPWDTYLFEYREREIRDWLTK